MPNNAQTAAKNRKQSILSSCLTITQIKSPATDPRTKYQPPLHRSLPLPTTKPPSKNHATAKPKYLDAFLKTKHQGFLLRTDLECAEINQNPKPNITPTHRFNRLS